MSKKYDSVSGIMSYLSSLEGLNDLVAERYAAGYQRGERLQDFCILGRWMTDSCGNFGKIISDIPAEYMDCPEVLTQDQLWKLIKEVKGDDSSLSFGYGSGCE